MQFELQAACRGDPGGADGYGENAPDAVLKVGQLVGARGNAEPVGAEAYCAA